MVMFIAINFKIEIYPVIMSYTMIKCGCTFFLADNAYKSGYRSENKWSGNENILAVATRTQNEIRYRDSKTHPFRKKKLGPGN